MQHLRQVCCLLLFLLLAAARVVSAFETVVIDPGHGGADEGTYWHHTAEKAVTLSIAKRLENILRDAGIHTVMTRRYDCYVSLDERAEMANRNRNSLMLSIHFNGASMQTITGFEIYHFAHSPSGQFIAEAITEAFVEKSLGRNRGTHTQDYAVLVRTNGLAVLVECGFISNKAEAARFSSAAGQQAVAEALALAVMRIKPLICFDPPECDLAKCVIYEKKYEDTQKKLEAASRKTETTPRVTSAAEAKPKRKLEGPSKKHHKARSPARKTPSS